MRYIIKLRWVLIVFAVALVVIGGMLITRIPKQEMPTLKTPYLLMTVATNKEHDALETNLSAIHEYLLSHEDVTRIQSRQIQDTILLEVLFSYDTTSVNDLKASLTNGLNQYEKEAIIQIDTIDFVARNSLIFMIHGNQSQLNETALELKNRLNQFDDIIDATHYNMFQESIQITLRPTDLATYDITPTEVIAAIESTTDVTQQIVDETSLNTLKNTPVQATPLVILSDVATVTRLSGTNTTYNQNAAVVVTANFNDGIDYTLYEDLINTLITDIEIDYDTTITPVVFLPEDVNDQFNDLLLSVVYAIVIVFIIIMIGLGLRQSLIVIAIIPTIIFTTIIFLYFMGYELHKLSIIGLILSIGMMVDNAIVLTEGTKTFLEQGLSKERAATAAIKKNFWPIFTATLTTLIAFGSILFIPGFVGELIKSMPITVLITITLSLVLSVLLTPILAMFFVKPKEHQEQKFLKFDQAIKRGLQHPFIILGIIAILGGIIGYLTITTRDINLYPSEEKTDFYINIYANSQDTLDDTILDIEQHLLANDQIKGVATAYRDDLPRFHFSETSLPLITPSARLYIETTYQKADMLTYIENFDRTIVPDDVTIELKTLKLSPPDAPLEVILVGETAMADAITIYDSLLDDSRINTINKTTNVSQSVPSLQPTALGLTHLTEDSILLLNQLLIQPLNFKTDISTETYPIIIDIDGSDTALPMMPIRSLTDGNHYPLSQLLTLSMRDISIIQHRYNNESAAYVSITPNHNRDITTLEEEIKGELSPDTTVYFTGENELFITLSNVLLIAGGIAVLLMYILLTIQFRNFIYPLIIFMTIPLAFIGSLSGLLLFNYDITISALIGMVSLIGVTVNIGILLIEEITKQSTLLPLEAACIVGTKHRLRPILLTSMTTILGLIPLYLTGGDFFRPLAITFIFGMIFATLLSLFVIPMMVCLSHKSKM